MARRLPGMEASWVWAIELMAQAAGEAARLEKEWEEFKVECLKGQTKGRLPYTRYDSPWRLHADLKVG